MVQGPSFPGVQNTDPDTVINIHDRQQSVGFVQGLGTVVLKNEGCR